MMMIREPSMRVRESAAEQIEERQSDWAYSKPIVVLDFLWNLGFIVASVVMILRSVDESPVMPLRVWIAGYDLQCVLHMVCVCFEYKRRRNQLLRSGANSSSGSDLEAGDNGSNLRQNVDQTSAAKLLESVSTIFAFIWWIIGFYWVSTGGDSLPRDSPQLYWLCIIFLAVDVFFVVICVAVAFVIGFAVCCCLPCIIAALYAIDQEGAPKNEIERLPQYKFRKLSDSDKQKLERQESCGILTECDTDSPIDLFLPREDAECCICLCAYNDGAVLRGLPCRHYFHTACIDKWLGINSTCPLCKFDILKNGDQNGEV